MVRKRSSILSSVAGGSTYLFMSLHLPSSLPLHPSTYRGRVIWALANRARSVRISTHFSSNRTLRTASVIRAGEASLSTYPAAPALSDSESESSVPISVSPLSVRAPGAHPYLRRGGRRCAGRVTISASYRLPPFNLVSCCSLHVGLWVWFGPSARWCLAGIYKRGPGPMAGPGSLLPVLTVPIPRSGSRCCPARSRRSGRSS
jgi:hypothetical protein